MVGEIYYSLLPYFCLPGRCTSLFKKSEPKQEVLKSGLDLFNHHVPHYHHRYYPLVQHSHKKCAASNLPYQRHTLLPDIYVSDDSRAPFLDAGPFGESTIDQLE